MKKNRAPISWETAPSILTVEEAATLLRIPRNAAYEAIRLGFLPAKNRGRRRIRVSKEVLRQVFGLGPQHDGHTAVFSRNPGGDK